MINRVSRLRNTVRCPTAFWSQAVHGLLRAWKALASRPRAYCTPDNGEHGTETLTWIEGAPLAPTAGRTLSPGLAHGRARFLRRTTAQSSVTACPRPACGPAVSGPRARRDHLARRLRRVKSVWRDGKIAGSSPRPSPPRPCSTWLRAGARRPVPRRRGVRPLAPLSPPAQPPAPDRGVPRRLQHRGPGERQRPRRPAAAHGRRHLRGPRPPRHRTAGHPGPRRPPGR